MNENSNPVGKIAASPVVYRVYQLYSAMTTASTLPPACNHASFKARILGSPKKINQTEDRRQGRHDEAGSQQP